jgi:hypothetical protein
MEPLKVVEAEAEAEVAQLMREEEVAEDHLTLAAAAAAAGVHWT